MKTWFRIFLCSALVAFGLAQEASLAQTVPASVPFSTSFENAEPILQSLTTGTVTNMIRTVDNISGFIGWRRNDATSVPGGTGTSTFSSSGISGVTNQFRTGATSARLNSYNAAATGNQAAFDINVDLSNPAVLSFWMLTGNSANGAGANIVIQLSTNGTTFSTVGSPTIQRYTTWTQFTYNLPASSNNAYVRFLATADFWNDVLIDDVTIIPPAAIDASLSAVSFSNMLFNQATTTQATVTVRNDGTAPLTQISFVYSISSGAQVNTGNIAISPALAFGASTTIPLSGINLASTPAQVTVTVATVNGGAESVGANTILNTITSASLVANPGLATTFVSPVATSVLGATVPITVQLQNLGNFLVTSATISWSLNGVQQPSYNWPQAGDVQSLGTNFATNVVLGNLTIQPLAYTIVATVATVHNGGQVDNVTTNNVATFIQNYLRIANYSASGFSSSYSDISSDPNRTLLSTTASDDSQFYTLVFSEPFVYQGIEFTSATVGTDGYVALTPPGQTWTNSSSPISGGTTWTGSGGVISAYGADLQGQTGYELSASTSNGITTIQWKNSRRYLAVGDSLNFQIKLYGNSSASPGRVEIVYGKMQRTFNSSVNAQIGLRASTTTFPDDINNLQAAFGENDWSTVFRGTANSSSVPLFDGYAPASGLGFRFDPPSGNNALIAGYTLAGTLQTAAPIAPTANAPQLLAVRVRNAGSNAINSGIIQWSINGLAQTPVSFTGPINPNSTLDVVLNSSIIFTADRFLITSTLANVQFAAGGADVNSSDDTQTRLFRPTNLMNNYALQVTTNAYTTLSAGDFTQVYVNTTATVGASPATTSSQDLINNERYRFPIPFFFEFNGLRFNTVGLHSDGLIFFGTGALGAAWPVSGQGFNTANTSGIASALSSTPTGFGTSDHFISAFTGTTDIQASTASASLGNLIAGVIGSTPGSRVFVAQWTNFQHAGVTGVGDLYNFQIRLNESDMSVEIRFGNIAKNATSRILQVGLRSGATGTQANLHAIQAQTGISNGVNVFVPTAGSLGTWSNPVAGGTTPVANVSPFFLPQSGLTYRWFVPQSAVVVESIQSPVTGSGVGAGRFLDVTLRNIGRNTVSSVGFQTTVVNGSGNPTPITFSGTLFRGQTIAHRLATDLTIPANRFDIVTTAATVNGQANEALIYTPFNAALTVQNSATFVARMQAASLSNYQFSTVANTFVPIESDVNYTNVQIVTQATTTGAYGSFLSLSGEYGYRTQLPFTFNYNGGRYNDFVIYNKGYASFGSGQAYNTASSTTPSSISPMSAITPFGVVEGFLVPFGFQNTSGIEAFASALTTGTIRTGVAGTAPNRVFTTQWTGFRRQSAGSDADAINFQLRMYETTGRIEFVYGTVSIAASLTAQVGLRGAYASTSFNGAANHLVVLSSVSSTDFANRTTTANWTQTAAGTLITSQNTISSTVFPFSGLTYIYQPGFDAQPVAVANTLPVATGTTTISVRIRNNGLAPITSLDVVYSVTSANTTTVSGTANLTGINIPGGQFADVPVIPSFNVLANERYFVTVTTTNPNGSTDVLLSNDVLANLSFISGMSGDYTYNSTASQTLTSYPTMALFHTDVVNRGLVGAVSLKFVDGSVTTETLSITPTSTILGLSSTNTVTFESQSGVTSNVVFLQTGSSTIFTLGYNANNYRFRNLTFRYTSTSPGTAISFASTGTPGPAISASNVNIQNNFFDYSATLGVSVSNTPIVASSVQTNNLTVSGNTFIGAGTPISISAPTTNPALRSSNVQVIGNIIIDHALSGISLTNVIDSRIAQNTITRQNRSVHNTGANNGIALSGSTLVSERNVIEQNTISTARSVTSATSFTFNGILYGGLASAGNENSIRNNIIFNLNGLGQTAGLQIGGAGVFVENNTVFSNDNAVFTSPAFGIFLTGNPLTNIRVRNNIVSLTRPAGTSNVAGIWINTALPPFDASAVITNNLYAVTITNASQGIGVVGGFLYSTLSGWQSISGEDQNSVVGNPQFFSTATDATTADLRIAFSSPAARSGVNISTITTDFAGTQRNPSFPDMGAYVSPVGLVLAPQTLNFGIIGSVSTQSISLSNVSATSGITVSNVASSSSFFELFRSGSAVSTPFTIGGFGTEGIDVRFGNVNGTPVGPTSATFTVTHSGANSPTTITIVADWNPVNLITSANAATNVLTTASFSWQAANYVDSYSFEYATNASLAGAQTVTGISSTSLNLTLAGNTQYFWRVRANLTTGTQILSETRSFTTLTPVETPQLLAPANAATQLVTSQTFSWTAMPNATSYRLQIATDNAFTAIVVNATSASSSQTQTLGYATQYFWRVQAIGSSSTSSFSAVNSFTTKERPNGLSLSMPSNPTPNVPFTVTVSVIGTSGQVTAAEASQTITLTPNSGFVSLVGFTPVTIPQGVASTTISVVARSTSTASLTSLLTASSTGLVSSSASFTLSSRAVSLNLLAQETTTPQPGVPFSMTLQTRNSDGSPREVYQNTSLVVTTNNPNVTVISGTPFTLNAGTSLFSMPIVLNNLTAAPQTAVLTVASADGSLSSVQSNQVTVQVPAAINLVIASVSPSGTLTNGQSVTLTVESRNINNLATAVSQATNIVLSRNLSTVSFVGVTTASIASGQTSTTITVAVNNLSNTVLSPVLTVSTTSGVALASTSISISVDAPAADRLVYTTVPSSLNTAQAGTVVVEARNSNNLPMPVVAATPISMTIGNAELSFLSGASGQITAGASSTTFSVSFANASNTAQVGTLTASASGLATTSASLTVTAPPATSLVFTAVPSSSLASGQSFTVTVEARNANGQTATLSSTLSVSLSQNNAQASLTGQTNLTIGAGQSSTTTTVSLANLSNIAVNTLLSASGLGTTTASLTVNPPAADRFVIITMPTSVAQNTLFAVTLEARNSNNLPMPVVANTTITATQNNGVLSFVGGNSFTLVAGASSTTFTVSLTNASTQVQSALVTFSASAFTSVAQSISVQAPPAVQIAIISVNPASPQAAQSFTMVAQVQNINGQAVAVTQNTLVTFAQTSPNLSFIGVTTTTILAGQSSVAFTTSVANSLQNNVTGNFTASATGYTAVPRSITIQGSLPTQLAILAISPIQPNSGAPFTVTVGLLDATNSPSASPTPISVTFSNSNSAITLSGQVSAVIPAGQTSTTFTLTLTHGQNANLSDVLTVSGNALASGSQPVTVRPPAPITVNATAYFQGLYSFNSALGTFVHRRIPVSLELRTGGAGFPNGSQLAAPEVTGIISTSGTFTAVFPTVSNGTYWIVLRAGSYMPVVSLETTLQQGTPLNINFSNPAQVYQSIFSPFTPLVARVLNGQTFNMIRGGDLTGDRSVNVSDFGTLQPNLNINNPSGVPPLE